MQAADAGRWDALTADIRRGALRAMEDHARKGVPMVVQRDGKIVQLSGPALDAEIVRLRRELRSVGE